MLHPISLAYPYESLWDHVGGVYIRGMGLMWKKQEWTTHILMVGIPAMYGKSM